MLCQCLTTCPAIGSTTLDTYRGERTHSHMRAHKHARKYTHKHTQFFTWQHNPAMLLSVIYETQLKGCEGSLFPPPYSLSFLYLQGVCVCACVIVCVLWGRGCIYMSHRANQVTWVPLWFLTTGSCTKALQCSSLTCPVYMCTHIYTSTNACPLKKNMHMHLHTNRGM